MVVFDHATEKKVRLNSLNKIYKELLRIFCRLSIMIDFGHQRIFFKIITFGKIATLEGHSKKVNRVLFHPEEDVIFSASADKTARIWRNTASGYNSEFKVRSFTLVL